MYFGSGVITDAGVIHIMTAKPPADAWLRDSEHDGETLEVQTTQGQHEFIVATTCRVTINSNGPSFLHVWGDDDWEDGPKKLRVFNLKHVVDYGWTL